MNENRTKDIDDMIFRLRSLNSVISILATVTAEGTDNVEFDPETLSDALYSVTHSVDAIIADLEEANANAINIDIDQLTAQKLGRIVDKEYSQIKAGCDYFDYKRYASKLLADAVGKKFAELFEPMNKEPELTDDELDSLGIPIVCISK